MLMNLIWSMAQKAKGILSRVKSAVKICKASVLKKKRILTIGQDDARSYIEKYRAKNDATGVPVNNESITKVSVIIPVYNSEEYIEDCIASITTQEIPYTYEVICVDDGSTDSSLSILKSIKNANLKIVTQKNAGAGAARNRGLDAASGEYVIFVDSDDKLVDGSIARMLKAAENAAADIVFGTVAKANADLSSVFYPRQKEDRVTCDFFAACSQTTGTPWGKCYKRSLWENVRFPECYAYEDTIIFMELFAKAKKFVMLGTPVYCFRSRKDSLYKRENASTRCADMVWVTLYSLKAHLSSGGKMTTSYYQLLLWHLSAITYSRARNLRDEKLLECIFTYAAYEVRALYYAYPIALNFEGKNAKIFKMIHQSFMENDYLLYSNCSEALDGLGLA